MTQTARAQISEMTETTENTLARTFGWETPEAALYRDCPTAFWLAPDGDGSLAPSPSGPVLQDGVTQPGIDDPEEPNGVDGRTGGMFAALVAAGPIFAATALLLSTGPGSLWWEPFARAAMSLMMFPLTIIFGVLLGVLPIVSGVLLLATAGMSVKALRRPAVWATTGGVMGAAIATLFDAGGSIGLALIATSIACATIARHFVTWHGPQAA